MSLYLLSSLSLLTPSESFPSACELRQEVHILFIDLLPEFLNCLHIAAHHSCALKRLSLKISWLFLGPFEPPKGSFP